jgi:hypothetical protein
VKTLWFKLKKKHVEALDILETMHHTKHQFQKNELAEMSYD